MADAWTYFLEAARERLDRGGLEDAAEALTQARQLAEGSAPPLELAKVLHASGLVAALRGNPGEAAGWLERAWALRSKALSPDAMPVQDTVLSLCGVWRGAGDEAEAEDVLLRWLKATDAAFGEESAQVAQCFGVLGAFYRAGGEPARAVPLLRRALEAGPPEGGGKSLTTSRFAGSLSRSASVSVLGWEERDEDEQLRPLELELARALRDTGELDEAAALFRFVAKDAQDAELAALALLEAAQLEVGRGQLASAESLVRAELERDRGGPLAAASWQRTLAYLAQQQGKADEAERLARQALASVQSVAGPDAPLTALFLMDAALFTLKRDPGQAREWLETAVSVLEATGPALGALRAEALAALAALHLYADAPDAQRALPLLQEALGVRLSEGDADSASVADLLLQLALAEELSGDTAAAAGLALRARALLP